MGAVSILLMQFRIQTVRSGGNAHNYGPKTVVERSRGGPRRSRSFTPPGCDTTTRTIQGSKIRASSGMPGEGEFASGPEKPALPNRGWRFRPVGAHRLRFHRDGRRKAPRLTRGNANAIRTGQSRMIIAP